MTEQDEHEHHLYTATTMSKAIEGLSILRDRSYYINLSILYLIITLLSYRAESRTISVGYAAY